MEFFKNIYDKYININLKDYPNIGFDFEINKVLFFVFLGLIAASVIISFLDGNITLMLKKLIRTDSIGEENARTLRDLGLDGNRALKFSLSRGGGVVGKIIMTVGKKNITYEEYMAAEAERRRQKKDKWKRIFGTKSTKKKNPESEITNAPSESETPAISVSEKCDGVKDAACEEETTAAEATFVADTLTSGEGESGEEGTIAKEVTASASSDKIDFETAKFYIPKDSEEYAKRYFERKGTSVTKTVLSCVLILAFYGVLMFSMPAILSAVNAIAGA